MDLVAMTGTSYFLGMLLVPLMGLAGAQGPCPTSCRCTMEILNCSKISSPPGFHRVPLPTPPVPPLPFTFLDFTGNSISSIGKEVWKAYPWAELLLLRDNRLRRLHNTSLEGLFLLTYLDLSYNNIEIVDKNVFEAVPFLRILNLSGNNIEWITDGTFQAWHGLHFLSKVDLSHNPLAVIQDPFFYKLPSLELLDLGSTKVTPRILEGILQISMKLKTLILPKKMPCCLCRLKDHIENSDETIRLQCTDSCIPYAHLCENEGPFKRMQDDIMKILETRTLEGSSLLNILPKNDTPDNARSNTDTLTLIPDFSNLATNWNLLKSFKLTMKAKGDEPSDVNWADKNELKQLYWLASLMRAALKTKTLGLDRGSPEPTIQNQQLAQVLGKSPDMAPKGSAEDSLRRKRNLSTLLRGKVYSEHRRSAVPPSDNYVALSDEYFSQRDLLEAALNKQLTPLIPNAPVRKLISHVIRILRMDCTAPTLHRVCAKLISKTGTLMKTLTEQEEVGKSFSLWMSHFKADENVSHKTSAQSRNMARHLDTKASESIPEQNHKMVLVLAFSATTTILIVIVIGLIVFYYQRWAFLGRRKKPLPDEELSAPNSGLMDRPPSTTDTEQAVNKTPRKTVDQLFYETEKKPSRGSARPPFAKTPSSVPSSVPTAAPRPPPAPSAAPWVKPSIKEGGSDSAVGSSETPSSKTTPSSTTEGGDDEHSEDKSSPTTEATSEVTSEATSEATSESEEDED